MERIALFSLDSFIRTGLSLRAYTDCSNAGGGGERVLWTAIKTIQMKFPEVISVIYSGDTEVTPSTIIDNVQVRPCVALLMTAPLQHYNRSENGSHCSPLPSKMGLRIAIPTFHNAPPVPWFSCPRIRSYLNFRPRCVHRHYG